MKICQYCGKEYRGRKDRPNSKFCSLECRRAATGAPQLYPCDNCGEYFLVSSTKIKQLNSGKRKYICCSKKCFDELQGPSFDDIKAAFDARGYFLITNEKLKAKEKYEYICPKHQERGSQFITYNNIKSGCGCLFCGQEKTQEKRRASYQEVKAAFNAHDMFLIEQPYVNSHSPLKYICYHHKDKGIQKMSYSNAQRQFCPYCNRSKGEEQISKFLQRNHINFTEQKRFPNLVGVKGRPLSYDFFIPSHNTLIEYQGEFHDGTARLSNTDTFIVQKEHDRRKREFATLNHINLIEIWYYQYKNIDNILINSLHLSVETAG